uniref:Pentacotripeptide-repeat region of PRORP domain-containing protein n=1 Tax=Entomoneis paludosa TaxID=265537 RepID=A0A7S2Y9L3_9STRA
MPNLKPTTSIYNAVINALSRAPGNRLKFAQKAEKYLMEMHRRSAKGEKEVQPDVRTWAAVLRSWAMSRAPDAAENAERVLDQLEDMHLKGETPIRPNYVCYTTVMGAWGHSRRHDALDKMEAILLRMEDHFTKTQEADMRPNTVSYVTAIDAFVRRNDRNAAKRAQATVDRMMKLSSMKLGHVRPTRIVFNTLIHAWSKSKESEAAQRAEEIFKWMEAQYQAGDYLVRPDDVSLCAVLNAWANQADSNGAYRAQQIFDHMQSLSLEQRGFHISIMMPNIVIKAIARSGDVDAVSRAEDILIRLENDFLFDRSTLRPDVTTYSSVINCCAYFRHNAGKAEALEVALRTFRKLCDMDGDKPNNITFGTLFKAISNLMPQEDEQRETLTRSLFDKCCEEGLVDPFVLSQIRAASPQLFEELIEETGGKLGPKSFMDPSNIEQILDNIPTEWSAYVLD